MNDEDIKEELESISNIKNTEQRLKVLDDFVEWVKANNEAEKKRKAFIESYDRATYDIMLDG